jgi:aminopeptidase N
MAHAVRPDSYIEISNFYTVTIYEKGAEVVGMLARMLGKEKFRQATDIYFSRFDGQAVTTEDFVQVMEEVSGQNLQQFRRWYTQAGTPELSVSWEYNNSSNQLHMKVIQKSRGEPFHIPLALALLNPQGNPVAIRQAGEQMILTERVLDIKNAEQHFTFVNITEPVVPSLLRGFSAPVKLTAEYSQDDLLFLLTYDQDGYVRWDAAQQLSLHAILQGMTQLREGRSFHLDQALVVAFEKVLREALLHNSGSSIDKSMLANLLTLPSEAYLAELFSSIDVDLIHNVREKVKHQLARQLQLVLAEIYHANKEKEAYTYSHEQVSRRALKNMALSYLVSLEDPAWHHAAWLQFEGSDNMTDALGALRALQLSPAQGARKLATELMENFYLQWKTEPLVVEQWFSLQASTPGKDRLSAIEKLLAHPAFDWNNPNKLRAVIGAFCNNNHIGFHKLDGSGYNFLIDQILKLNKTNPQIASRLLTPMTRWRKHDESRQQLMRSALQKLAAQEDLSKDVSEVVFKSLELVV